MQLIQNITVDITVPQVEFVYANQNDDESRTIVCHVQDNGTDFPLESYMIILRVKKTNGYSILKTIGIDLGSVSGNTVTFPIIDEMTIANGRQIVDIEIYDKTSQQILHTCTFYLVIRGNAISNTEIQDSNDYETVYSMYQTFSDETSQKIDEFQAILDEMTNEIMSSSEPENLREGDYWLEIL